MIHKLELSQEAWRQALATNDVVELRYTGKESFRIEAPYSVDWPPRHVAVVPREAVAEMLTLSPGCWEAVSGTLPAPRAKNAPKKPAPETRVAAQEAGGA